MEEGERFPSLVCMRKRRMLIGLVLLMLLLAVGGWVVQGLRWAMTGSAKPRRELAWA